MKLTSTELPWNQYYESYDDEYERNVRYNVLKAQWRKPIIGQYKSASGMIYFITYS